ncbi:MAG: glycosyltransferase [Sphingobacteriales bacterium]|nr:MAG: glycosyltransferase [Sphingobacteriales bacterium]
MPLPASHYRLLKVQIPLILLFTFLCPVFATVLFPIFLLAVTIQVAYALYFFARVFHLPITTRSTSPAIPVSIIICAKNEAENLQRNLPAILAQRYANAAGKPMFEVVVVNDASDDATDGVLGILANKHEHLRIVTIGKEEERYLPGKKHALGKGVATATNAYLLMTDADCKPASEYWLQCMADGFTEGKEIVLGVGKYDYQPGWLNAFVRWETMHTFLQYSTYALAGRPYMAVGRNMACTKEAFNKAQGGEVWSQLPSGDDDLLIRNVANKHNVSIMCNADALTISPAKNNVRDWLLQKQRHMSTGKYYKTFVKLALGKYALSHTLMWICFIALLFTNMWQEALLAIACRCLVYYLFWWHTAERMQEKKLVRWFLPADFGWMLYNFVLSPYIIWKNKRQWK